MIAPLSGRRDRKPIPQSALDIERQEDVGPDPVELGNIAIAEGRIEHVHMINGRYDDRRSQVGPSLASVQ